MYFTVAFRHWEERGRDGVNDVIMYLKCDIHLFVNSEHPLAIIILWLWMVPFEPRLVQTAGQCIYSDIYHVASWTDLGLSPWLSPHHNNAATKVSWGYDWQSYSRIEEYQNQPSISNGCHDQLVTSKSSIHLRVLIFRDLLIETRKWGDWQWSS
jgi:hypothetical protein